MQGQDRRGLGEGRPQAAIAQLQGAMRTARPAVAQQIEDDWRRDSEGGETDKF